MARRSTTIAGRSVIEATLAGVLSLLSASALWSLLPLALGMRSDVVMSGSMMPRLAPGDVVISIPAATSHVSPGRIALFTDPARPERTLVHRLLARNSDGTWTTKGDANEQPDSTPLPPELLRGVAVVRIPFIGLPAYWLHTGQIAPLVGTFTTLLVFLTIVTRPPSSSKHRRAVTPGFQARHRRQARLPGSRGVRGARSAGGHGRAARKHTPFVRRPLALRADPC
jgi:signal peptidase I